MSKEDVVQIVIETINNYLDSMGNKNLIAEDSKLIGRGSFLESIDLVTIIIDIESKFRDMGKEITLASEKAMSVNNSPFLTVTTLADFIHNQVE